LPQGKRLQKMWKTHENPWVFTRKLIYEWWLFHIDVNTGGQLSGINGFLQPLVGDLKMYLGIQANQTSSHWVVVWANSYILIQLLTSKSPSIGIRDLTIHHYGD
jgi:hypothetical protein